MPVHFTRHPENPIVTPGLYPWRLATTFNPGCIYDNGRFYLYERAAGQLRPFHCTIGLLSSTDGVHFTHLSDQPVFTPEMAGSKHGSVQDPRVVKIDQTYYMTYAFRPFAWSSHPTGVGIPDSHESEFPGVLHPPPDPTQPGSNDIAAARPDNLTRSGIAISNDAIHWQHHCWPTAANLDDRDVILFPEKINGLFALLRRPLQFVGPPYGTNYPAIWICFSKNLKTWSTPKLLAKAQYPWEDNRIGGSTPPIKTPKGWLVLYHGVQTLDPAIKRVVYRLGAMLLDLHDPTQVIARTRNFIMQPETYYEKFGLYIPNVIFPTANVVKDGLLHLYYGCCDTAIALATIPLDDLLNHVLQHPL